MQYFGKNTFIKRLFTKKRFCLKEVDQTVRLYFTSGQGAFLNIVKTLSRSMFVFGRRGVMLINYSKKQNKNGRDIS